MITKVSSGKTGQMVYYFSNGVVLSFVWDWGSYTENHQLRPKDYTKMDGEAWSSDTVECYSMGDETNGISKYLERKYGDNPAGHIPVNDIPKILRRADK